MNEGTVSIHRTRKMIGGLTLDNILPSKGYLVKVQQKAARVLTAFT